MGTDSTHPDMTLDVARRENSNKQNKHTYIVLCFVLDRVLYILCYISCIIYFHIIYIYIYCVHVTYQCILYTVVISDILYYFAYYVTYISYILSLVCKVWSQDGT